jgi:preprotein translocase subunit SecD
MRTLLAVLAMILLACSRSSITAADAPNWIEYGITTESADAPAGTVKAYPYFGDDHEPDDRAYVELPVQGCRLESASKSVDDLGFPALSCTIDKRDSPHFEAFSAKHIDRALVLIVNGSVVSEANINNPLPGMFQISGRFTDAQVQELLKGLQ